MVTATAAKTKLTPDVEKLCKEFREAQLRARKSQDEYLLAHLEMGESLAALKKGVDHGEWLPLFEEKLHITERYAQHLMNLVGTPLAKQIRSQDTDLLAQLPLDVRALDSLANLPPAKLQKALRDWDFAELTRPQIERKVNVALGLELKIRKQPTVAPATKRAANGQEHVEEQVDRNESDHEQAGCDPDADEDLGPDVDSEESDEDAGDDYSQPADDDRQVTDEDGCDDRAEDDQFWDEMDYHFNDIVLDHFLDQCDLLTNDLEGFEEEVIAAIPRANDKERREIRARVTRPLAILQRVNAALDAVDER